MVWSLIHTDPLSGGGNYYIYAKGTYKVGRKGCDVNIGNDKTLSRVHAEIIVDAMESMSSNKSSKVRIRDCSKYGTSVSKNSNLKQKVNECPGKEMHLADGDLISFGAGNVTYSSPICFFGVFHLHVLPCFLVRFGCGLYFLAVNESSDSNAKSYPENTPMSKHKNRMKPLTLDRRFSYVPLIFYLCNFTSSQGPPSTQDRASSIGACVTHSWTTECTHVIVDPFMPVTDGILEAILSKKPLVLSTWLEFVAETRIRNEIPSYSSYIPTLTLEDTSVTVTDYRTRENCLAGYTFLLDSVNKYKFEDKMQSLLKVAGAKVLSVEDFDSNSQGLLKGENNRLVLVSPATSADHSRHRSSLPKIMEVDLISAVISGYLDSSAIVSPSILVSSSCSTGETVVADSDDETATSDHLTTTAVDSCDDIKRKKSMNLMDCTSENTRSTDFVQQYDRKKAGDKEATKYVQREDSYTKQHAAYLEKVAVTKFVELNRAPVKLEDKSPECLNSDVLYSQNLIVRDTYPLVSTEPVAHQGVINFKRFRKGKIQSGNSFSNLVPFSKLPYSDSDYDKEIIDYVIEEKKRKQMEAVADDLFNSEKGRQRGVAGSLRRLLG